MSRAIRYTGQLLVDLIPKIYDTPSRVVRVLGEDGSEKIMTINAPVTVKGEELQEIGKIYDLSVGQYDVVCSAGASYTTRRQEAAQAMIQIIPQFPQLMQAAGDLVVKAMDWPGAEGIAERLEKMLPPELRPMKEDDDGVKAPPPELMAAQQQIEQMNQAMQAMQAELQSKQGEEQQAMAKLQLEQAKLQIEQEKVAIDRYNAETNRIKVEADIALKANDDLTESEREQFKADLALRMKALDQEHEVEMEAIRKQFSAPEIPPIVEIL
jgi:hypothetical protein